MRPLLLIAAICIATFTFAQDKAQFIENKGQWNKRVRFEARLSNGSFFLAGNGFTMVQHNNEDLESLSHGKDAGANTILRSHAVEVSFVNSSSPTVVMEQVESSYNNYFIGNDPSTWASHCRIAGAVLYKDIYPGIDIRFYSNSAGLKYDIIVHPGADLSMMAMQYKGVESLSLQQGQLIIPTTTGNIKEHIPYSYTITQNGSKQNIDCYYTLSGNTVKFAAGAYDHSKTLVIDPLLVFSTFTGSAADNWGYTSAYGADGSFYAAGIVFGNGFPANAGAYQTTFQGGMIEDGLPGYDMAIMKFNATGTGRVYATYIGGTGNECPLSVIENALGELVIAGRTNSSNYPSSSNIGTGGAFDICITKLSANGSTIVNSRKIGGSGNDGVNVNTNPPGGAVTINRNYGDDIRADVALDAAGNIIFAGCTRSADFPTTAAAFQTTFAGSQDGVLLKFDPTLNTLLFSSFIGGSGDDGTFAIAVNSITNNIYIGGSTTSSNLPGDKTATISSVYQGGTTDGFISMIDAAGATLLKTTYIGTFGVDMLYGLKLDKNNFPYITGTTTGSFPVVNATFSQAGGKQFIGKIQPDLSGYVFSTVFGKGQAAPDLSITGFNVDDCENIYVTGWGGSINYSYGYPNAGTNGLTVTPAALRTTSDDNDLYFFVLQKNAASQLYGSFFGQVNGTTGDHVHGMNRIDRYGVLYQAVCAACNGGPNPFPTTPGVWSTTNGGGAPAYCNMAAVKIDFDFCEAPFPVTLSSFTAGCSSAGTILKWTTATEQHNNRFEVEKRISGMEWKTIGSVPATNLLNGSSYQFKDLAAGEALYRLKQVDDDGKYSYSPIQQAKCNTTRISVYPVPANDRIQVAFLSNSKQKISVKLVDMTGKTVFCTEYLAATGNNSFPVNTASLANGTYILELNGGYDSQWTKIVIQK